MRATWDSFFSGMPDNSIGSDIVNKLLYLGEHFGFHLKIRDSRYREENGEDNQNESSRTGRILRRAVLVCIVKQHGQKECPFQLVIRSVPVTNENKLGSSSKTTAKTTWRYLYDDKNAVHTHGVKNAAFLARLPPEMKRKAVDMYGRLRMSLTDVLSYLEDEFGVRVNRDQVRRQLKYQEESLNPKEAECYKLCEVLMSLSRKDASSKVFFTTKPDSAMHSAAWALGSWLDDYEKYGIVAGVRMDCKVSSNRFGLPMFSINGRTKFGDVCTFFMGFLPDQTEESFIWVLQQFQSCIPVSPAMVAVDQDAACISAISKVMPSSFICLDEWHVKRTKRKM